MLQISTAAATTGLESHDMVPAKQYEEDKHAFLLQNSKTLSFNARSQVFFKVNLKQTENTATIFHITAPLSV